MAFAKPSLAVAKAMGMNEAGRNKLFSGFFLNRCDGALKSILLIVVIHRHVGFGVGVGRL